MNPKIVIVEDSSEKAQRLEDVVSSVLPSADLEIARSLTDAFYTIRKSKFDLLVLDISMDIVGRSQDMLRENHDMLGGLRFAKELFLYELDLPTIVVTAHDSFIEKNASKSTISSFMSISQLSVEFDKLLGSKFLGCISYQKEGWKSKLQRTISEASLV